jgi:hypothetical protein
VSAIFISHSSREDTEARAVRERLCQVLTDKPYLHTILLDETGIRAGNLWRPKLYRWLAECGGAVLMLTEQALASDWVKKEAAILLWRQALGSRVVVVPLLIGVTKDQVEKAFPAIEVFESHYQQITDGDEAGPVLKKVAAAFGRASDLEDRLGSWARRLISAVSYLDDISRAELARALDGAADAWSDTPDGVPLIVHALLHSPSMWDVQTAVQPVLPSFQNPRSFVELVSPVAIPAETAAGILTACARPPGDRVLVLTGTSSTTAIRYIRRASCVNTFYRATDPPGPADEAGVDRLFDDILEAIAQNLGDIGTDQAGRLAFVKLAMSAEDRRGRVIQVLRSRSRAGQEDDGLTLKVLQPLVARLRLELPHLVILVLAWPPGQDAPALGIEGAHVITPAVEDAREEELQNSYLRQLEMAARS